jgi:hypothetical protein
MEQEGEASSSRIHLPYRDVCKFQHNAGRISKMLWKMLQELGYEKQLKYYGTQVMYEGFESVWHVQVYFFTPILSEEFLRSRRSMPPLLQDATSTLEFVMPLVKLIWSLVRIIANSWME